MREKAGGRRDVGEGEERESEQDRSERRGEMDWLAVK